VTPKRWIFLFSVLILFAVLLLIFQTTKSTSDCIVISQDGQILKEIDLHTVSEPFEMTVYFNDRFNTIHITDKTAYVSHADCDNQLCIEHGPLEKNGSPIVCLPNRLVIRWQNSQVDG